LEKPKPVISGLTPKKQLSRFLDFNNELANHAEMVNNYDWMKEFSFLDFIRDIGKHITVNYMMAKDSVKQRLDSGTRDGLSFTEFTYQLVQGYDFLHLYKTKNCKLQMGGSDQWGNITTGTELIRRIEGGEAFALTCQLITKADGGKFGKTETGNIWLDSTKTMPYKFYQFWLNTSDADAEKYIKIFTLIPRAEFETLLIEHNQAPHERLMQKRLAKEVTVMIHGEEAYNFAVEASQILFGKGVTETLKRMDENTLLSVLEGVPAYNISIEIIDKGINVIDLLAQYSAVFPSKSEARRTISGGGVSINKEKIDIAKVIDSTALLNEKYILVQSGKKNYSLLIAG
jgi:tyrosyl-tRNA synthetase